MNRGGGRTFFGRSAFYSGQFLFSTVLLLAVFALEVRITYRYWPRLSLGDRLALFVTAIFAFRGWTDSLREHARVNEICGGALAEEARPASPLDTVMDVGARSILRDLYTYLLSVLLLLLLVSHLLGAS